MFFCTAAMLDRFGKSAVLLPIFRERKNHQYHLSRIIRIIRQRDVRDIEKGRHVLGIPKPVQTTTSRVAGSPWPKPATGWVAVSVDGSFLQADGTVGIGIVLRDHRGAVLLAACKAFTNYSIAYEAELSAIKEGLTLALKTSDAPLLLQSDSAAALKTLRDEGLDRSPL